MVTQQELGRWLESLRHALPSRAPDFGKGEILATWHRALGGELSTGDFGALFRVLTGNHDVFPSPKQILEAKRRPSTQGDTDKATERRDKARMFYEQAEERCTWCDCTGLMSVRDKIMEHDTAFACTNCTAVERWGLSMQIPPWRDEYERYFSVVRFSKHKPRSTSSATIPRTIADLARMCDARERVPLTLVPELPKGPHEQKAKAPQPV